MPRESRPATDCRYVLVESQFGEVGIVWRETGSPRVLRVLLPATRQGTLGAIRRLFPAAAPRACPAITQLAGRVRRFLRGEPAKFDTTVIALDRCPPFQRRVLLAEHRVPRGRVTTYAALARRLGKPGAARAVGQALARNPFPLVIPCHRAVKSDGTLGGFQGGLALKRRLLEMEGVEFTRGGRVAPGPLTAGPVLP